MSRGLTAQFPFTLDPVEGLFPRNQVHLIGGASGSGKTRLVLQLLAAIAGGVPFNGRQTNFTPWIYIGMERAMSSILEILDQTGINLDRSRLLVELSPDVEFETLWSQHISPRGAKLVVIDPIVNCFSRNPNELKHVREFLVSIANKCDAEQITVIGTMQAAKRRSRDKVYDPRERLYGSVAWGCYSNTVVFMESENPMQTSCTRRTAHVSLRTAPGYQWALRFNEKGLLAPETLDFQPVTQAPSSKFMTLKQRAAMLIESLKPGQILEARTYLDLRSSDRTGYRELEKLCAQGTLSWVTKGKYVKPYVT